MCGITACIGDLPPVPIQELSHRGPDEFSKFESSWLNVEFARLSITGGAQGQSPARSKSGRWLIFLNRSPIACAAMVCIRVRPLLNFPPTFGLSRMY